MDTASSAFVPATQLPLSTRAASKSLTCPLRGGSPQPRASRRRTRWRACADDLFEEIDETVVLDNLLERAEKRAAGASAYGFDLEDGEVLVRFINTPDGVDKATAAKLGENLLNVSDTAGVSIPRGCKTGLCGVCTSDIVDEYSPDGVQTVRACKTSVVAPDGSDEMVVDVARMKDASRTGSGRMKDPMARFENMDTDYVAGAPPKR